MTNNKNYFIKKIITTLNKAELEDKELDDDLLAVLVMRDSGVTKRTAMSYISDAKMMR